MNTASLGVILASGNVQRCHTVPTIKPQTVAAHTWRTVVILHWLYAPQYPPPELTYAMVMHDVPEISTGDTPGDVKHRNAPLADALEILEREFMEEHGIFDFNLNELQQAILSLCDRADLCMYALDEADMGNVNLSSIASRAYEMFKEKQKIIDSHGGWTIRMEILSEAIAERIRNAERRMPWPN